ncbi:UDP-N-acetylglucosamine transferase subunit ALG13-like [Vitis vinifera]|uniref:UDP-N-acetylglucosamine transferase subunit ALG13-like n=1 Tax=Vitis vinifera TaxID=29760 RepID=A0A438FCC5_VITVI|nr:UDP-N-acetylglucosamine transferase subunit ALG13-like [Vitis vinifera]
MQSTGEDGSLVVDYFIFSSSIADNLRSASLVISHAGSGSIFETLRLRKPLIVVVNEDLMDNHQSELAEELAERKHLFCAHPQTLFQTVASMNLESLLPYHPGDAAPVAKLINRTVQNIEGPDKMCLNIVLVQVKLFIVYLLEQVSQVVLVAHPINRAGCGRVGALAPKCYIRHHDIVSDTFESCELRNPVENA